MDLWEKIRSCTIFDIHVIKVILSVSVFAVFIILRQLLLKLALRIIKKYENTKKINASPLIKAFDIPIRVILLLIGILISIMVLDLPAHVQTFINRVFESIIALCMLQALYRSSPAVLTLFLRCFGETDTSENKSLFILFENVYKIITIIIGISLILRIWDYDIAALLTGLGLGGLAFALAAKDTVANLFGSIMIMLDKPFSPGDWIITSRVEGCVESIGFRSTRVRTSDQALVTIPNSIISNEAIINMSRIDNRRMNLRLSIPSSVSSELISEYMNRLRHVLEAHPDTVPGSVIVCFERFNGPKLDILIDLLIQTTSWKKALFIQDDINYKIKTLAEELGVVLSS